jgi:hypothetical protein
MSVLDCIPWDNSWLAMVASLQGKNELQEGKSF